MKSPRTNERSRALARLWGYVVLILLVNGPALAQAADPVRVLALGDSLTAGFNLPPGQDWPTVMQRRLADQGLAVTIDNAGVSGDTTAGGLARLDWAMGSNPDVVVVELGANDGLRGIDPAVTRDNLDAILTRIKASGARVLLTGMLAPPNLGREYGAEFNAVFPDLAEKHGVAFYPFFLDGLIQDPSLLQNDGKHPTAEGVEALVDKLLPHVLPLIDQTREAG